PAPGISSTRSGARPSRAPDPTLCSSRPRPGAKVSSSAMAHVGFVGVAHRTAQLGLQAEDDLDVLLVDLRQPRVGVLRVGLVPIHPPEVLLEDGRLKGAAAT